MLIETVPLQLGVLSILRATDQTINYHFPNIVHVPFVVPLLLQRPKSILAKSTPEFGGLLLPMRATNVFIQHGFKVKHPTAQRALHRRRLVVVLHVLGYHLLRIKLTVAKIALQVRHAVDFLVLGEVARVAEGFVAERTFVDGELRVLAEMRFVLVHFAEHLCLANLEIISELHAVLLIFERTSFGSIAKLASTRPEQLTANVYDLLF